MKIVLHTDVLVERGVTTAVAEYARQLRLHLNAEVWIAFNSALRDRGNPQIERTLASEFDLIPYESVGKLNSTIRRQADPDLFYAMKSGAMDEVLLVDTPNAVHAVFQEYAPHGSSYAYISQWLAEKMRRNLKQRANFEIRQGLKSGRTRSPEPFNARRFDHVPYIVRTLPRQDNYRSRLNLPQDAFVFGSLSASDQFDVDFVRTWLISYIEKNPDAFFVGPNLQPFVDHPRIIFAPTITDAQEKSDYLSSLDFLLHARNMGESFGLAICEALSQGTPVASFRGGRDRNHVALLKNSEWLFSNSTELNQVVESFRRLDPKRAEKARLLVKPFTPEVVIERFRTVFLNCALDKG